MTPDDVRSLSGEELIAIHGAKTEQMIIDLLVAVIKKGEEEARAIEQKLLQVQILRGTRKGAGGCHEQPSGSIGEA